VFKAEKVKPEEELVLVPKKSCGTEIYDFIQVQI
jgi:hypothetical protein